MPIHDWGRIPAGLFHDFHETWCVAIKTGLNRGILPRGLTALVEQRTGASEADAIDRPTDLLERKAPRKPRRSDRVVVKHRLGRTIAVIEIVPPGNKSGQSSLREFVQKSAGYLRAGVHLLIIDLLPPTPRDPHGIHKAIWDEFQDEEFTFPAGKNLTFVSYEAAALHTHAFIEPVAVGDEVPDMALFIAEGAHVRVPLRAAYQTAWDSNGEAFQVAVETGVMPEPDGED